MALPTAQISAPGLTEDQIQVEMGWLAKFTEAAESLDWTKWERWWEEDAFLQFGNAPRAQGKEAIAANHAHTFHVLENLHHEFTRYSFDAQLGLIYQTSTVSYKVKDDPEKRTIRVPGVSVLHKRVGENLIKGCEIYVDNGPVAAVVQEVLDRKSNKE